MALLNNLNIFILEAHTSSMKMESVIYAVVGFLLPLLVMLGGAMAKIYNMWLYVLPLTWFVMALFIFISFYKF